MCVCVHPLLEDFFLIFWYNVCTSTLLAASTEKYPWINCVCSCVCATLCVQYCHIELTILLFPSAANDLIFGFHYSHLLCVSLQCPAKYNRFFISHFRVLCENPSEWNIYLEHVRISWKIWAKMFLLRTVLFLFIIY